VRRFVWTAILAIIGVWGCGKSAPPAPATPPPVMPTPQITAASPDKPLAPAIEPNKAVEAPVELSNEAAPINEVAVAEAKPSTETATTAPETTEAPPATAESKTAEPVASTPSPTGQTKRLLLYTPSGPLIVEFVLRIDGHGAVEMNDAFVDELLKAADTDKDGDTKWMEALSNQRSGIPQFVGQSGGDTQTFYDRDRDGTVDRSELWNLLGHGDAGLAFRLDHVDGPGGTTTAGEVARLLDTDGDGALTLEEIDLAPAQLRLADVNDDERLTPDDLGAPTMGMPQPAMNTGAMGNVVTTASILDDETDWGVIHYELDERYLMHGQFRGEPLPLFPELAKKLDADENGLLSLTEAEILNYLTPHVRMEIDFGVASAGGKLQLADLRSELSSGVQQRQTERSAQFDWPNLTLAFSVADNTSAGDVTGQAEAEFSRADQDKNGYLEKAELPENQQALFDGWDGNADGKVYLDELRTALEAERKPLLNRIRAVVTPGEHSLLAALDANRDGSLSAREIQESPERLRASDRNADGRVTKDEIPTRISVHFERGMGAGPAAPVSYGAPVAADKAEAPVWFQRMDANSDGDISPREFLGAPETFSRLDKDGDGLLSLEEAAPAN
jgi:Ca2+-binding EF-hand superfamily protein